ncbi:MAG TPA: polysaccharide biosynthesis protein, partial [Flavobacteriales bacterium]|nr:polysaccharide biosynthesis protein [Flavobacteriales bacterium]
EFSDKHTPRWVIFLIDLGICCTSFTLAYLLRFEFDIPPNELDPLPYTFPLLMGVRALSFYLGKTYSGVVRYTSTKDAERIFLVIASGSVVLSLVNISTYYTAPQIFIIPFSIIIMDFIFTVFIMTSSRLIVKSLYMEMSNPSSKKQHVIIVGAGEAGIIAKRTLDRDAGTHYKVFAFIDDDEKKAGKMLEGTRIHKAIDLGGLLSKNDIRQVIISIQNLSAARKQEIIDVCLGHNTRVLSVPPVNNWINGELSFRQIQRIKIEDLLEREPIKLNIDEIKSQIEGKTVLVTGGAGSIGSELSRQIGQYNPKKLIVLDQAESPLYDLELELREKHGYTNFEAVLGDVRNKSRMANVFTAYSPDLVYHAAAYKHVPTIEENPSEGLLVNVGGTKIVADLAVEHGVSKFVLVSTDKAVNPTNVMGASKLIAEMYCRGLSHGSGATNFITTRFGNVLGSNGSVILRFRKQIESGGPVTVTDPEVSRYFMTIPEACQLVLEAGAMGKGGEIFIFDMGESMKIDDLAKKMIKLSKLKLNKDINLVYTGLRKGEKLIEELLNDGENTTPTHHPKIMIAKVEEQEWEAVLKNTQSLIDLFDAQDNDAIVSMMKKMLPEYQSSNSEFEKLDKKV